MVLFKRPLLFLILEGRKTQTRRIHRREWKAGRTYVLRTSWYGKPEGYIIITRKFRQRLGDISLEDVKREGFDSFQEFRRAWTEIHGSWDPEETVIVYEFRLVS